MWKKYPENKPTESGYYITYYYNVAQKGNYEKALWFSCKEDKWIWDREFTVKAYVEASFNKYYVPCMLWGSENKLEAYKEDD